MIILTYDFNNNKSDIKIAKNLPRNIVANLVIKELKKSTFLNLMEVSFLGAY